MNDGFRYTVSWTTSNAHEANMISTKLHTRTHCANLFDGSDNHVMPMLVYAKASNHRRIYNIVKDILDVRAYLVFLLGQV